MFTPPAALHSLFLRLPLSKAYCGPRQHAYRTLIEHRRQLQLLRRIDFVVPREKPAPVVDDVRFGKLSYR